MTAVELWRRGQAGWPRRFPIVQLPNTPLLAALAGWGVAESTKGSVHDGARWVFTLALAVWGLDETTRGVNWFRRGLGVGVLAWLAATLLRER
jgi:hypothetical protein